MITHYVVHTNFHARHDLRRGTSPYGASDDVVSRHHSLERATEAARRMENPHCVCGCVVVVDAPSVTVRVWDEVAGHYSIHGVSQWVEARARRLPDGEHRVGRTRVLVSHEGGAA